MKNISPKSATHRTVEITFRSKQAPKLASALRMAFAAAFFFVCLSAWSQQIFPDNSRDLAAKLPENPQRRASLRAFCPLPADQGALPASAAHALCNALSIQRQIQRQAKDSLAFSASYLFNSLKRGKACDKGIRLSEALQFLEKQGVCPISIFPIRRYDCAAPPAIPKKWLHRIRSSKRLFSLRDDAKKKLDAVRSSLDHSMPVVAVLAANLGFDALASAANDWRLALLAGAQDVQYEAFVVTGYDDDRQTFELMGCYGTNWGDAGFARIGYREFAGAARYGFVLQAGTFGW